MKLLIVIVMFVSSVLGRPAAKESLCQPDHLTVYRVVLTTFWNEQNFPKHFPQWRPPAQWSKVVGRSHDKSYVLFRLGKKASEGLKIFAESGRSDALDAQSQGEGGVYDEFNAPPITAGEGRTEAEFFVDGNHSRVSLISKMTPSPDWFIGIDGFDLCVNGKWLDGITIEVDPVDAGTDNGFAFTSPNWPTEPQGIIYRLTSSYPNHPASSFYYPTVKKLPTVASFQIIKVKEYELSEVFHHTEDTMNNNEILKMEHISYVYEEGEGNTFVLKKNGSNNAIGPAYQTALPSTTTSTTTTTQSPIDFNNEIEEEVLLTTQKPLINKVDPVSSLDETLVVKNIVDVYGSHKKQIKTNIETNEIAYAAKKNSNKGHLHHKSGKGNNKKDKDVRKIRPPRDCQVGEWSEWTPCSKACDIGESTRYRKVIHHARRGGRPCPPMMEKKWCGSARSCNRRYFNWSKK